jgi:hypothetical protein
MSAAGTSRPLVGSGVFNNANAYLSIGGSYNETQIGYKFRDNFNHLTQGKLRFRVSGIRRQASGVVPDS